MSGSGEVVELRHTNTIGAKKSDFNSVTLAAGDCVDILLSEQAEDGTPFMFVKVGRKKGWVKASYVQIA